MNKQLKIGWLCWEPALQGNPFTSAGGGEWTAFLFKKLKENGHQVVWLGPLPEPENTTHGEVKDCDVAVVCWRWDMADPERHQAYVRQNLILHLADRYGIPVLVHDQDYKISDADMKVLKFNGVKVARPELFPESGIKSLIFPNPYDLWEDTMPLGPMQPIDLIYVGNNYERWDQTVKFIKPFQRDHEVTFYGNWIDPSPLRQTPEEVLVTFPHIQFGGRLDQKEVIKTLRYANTTINLFKPDYGKTGFMTIRWAEAAKAGVPAFLPADFTLPMRYEEAFNAFGLLVVDGDDLIKKYRRLVESPERWRNAVEMQRSFVNEYMAWQRWESMIFDVATKGSKES